MKEEETTKYLLKFDLEVDGVVEENDVIGAIFGQTEGLIGPQFDLREMQRVGKIGRIVVRSIQKNGKTKGEVSISCGLDMPSTTLLASLVESVDQIGPYKAAIALERIVDYRKEKIQQIMSRAKELLDEWKIESIPEAEDLVDKLRKHLAPAHITEVGRERIPAGPNIRDAKEIILVEGRADVNNLLKYGLRNVMAIEGGKVPNSIKKFIRGKAVTAFLDGDRGGEMNLKKLLQTVKVDYIAHAPPGKEVEDLKPQEIFDALRNKKEVKAPPTTEREELKVYTELIEKVNGALEALLIDKSSKVVEALPVSNLVNRLKEIKSGTIDKIVFDGIVTQRLIDTAEEKKVGLLIGNRMGDLSRKPTNIDVFTFGE